MPGGLPVSSPPVKKGKSADLPLFAATFSFPNSQKPFCIFPASGKIQKASVG